MFLKSLYLHNFRLYEESYFEFSPHVNMICGKNAAGKTSILEAIHFLTSGNSFRTHQSSHMIRYNASYFYLEAHFVKHGVEQKLRFTYSPKDKKIYYNNTPFSSASSLLGLLIGVLYSPEDIQLIQGTPQSRRDFLDFQISQADPLYHHHLNRYQRAMRQRNYLLKSKNFASIESWEYEMASSAAFLHGKRHSLVEQLQAKADPIHSNMTEGNEVFSVIYKPSVKVSCEQIRQYYIEQYHKNRFRESSLGCTLYGPHKDDLSIALAGQEARFFASEGQQRTCAAALRLAEWEQLKELSDEKPIMLIDDVGASLDNVRLNRFLKQLSAMSQVFITTPNEIALPDNSGEVKITHL